MKRILFFIAIAVFTNSCDRNKTSNNKPFSSLIVDTFAYDRINQTNKILNFSSLENGVDSFEIRLWSSFGHTDLNFVEILKYEDSNWHLSQTRYWFTEDFSNPNRRNKIFLDSGKIEYSRLAIPFSEFIDTLTSFNLIKFPTQSQIPGFEDNVADGEYYNLEVSTKNYYKHLFYHQPSHYSDSSNRKFIKILNLLSLNPNEEISNP